MTTSIQDRIDNIKGLLDTAETNYAHALAAGEWEACSTYKSEVCKYRSAIGKMIKQKMGLR